MYKFDFEVSRCSDGISDDVLSMDRWVEIKSWSFTDGPVDYEGDLGDTAHMQRTHSKMDSESACIHVNIEDTNGDWLRTCICTCGHMQLIYHLYSLAGAHIFQGSKG